MTVEQRRLCLQSLDGAAESDTVDLRLQLPHFMVASLFPFRLPAGGVFLRSTRMGIASGTTGERTVPSRVGGATG